MIKLANIINEAPIDTFQTIGNFEKGSSFRDKRDRDLITHPVTITKVKDFFKNTTVDFDFYFVNLPGRRKFVEKGKVKEEFLYEKFPNGLGITKEQLKDGKINTDNITIFFVGNSAAEKIPMTAWTMAHRFGHAIKREYAFDEYVKFLDKNFVDLLNLYNVNMGDRYSKYDKLAMTAKAKLFNQIGTMRSARQGEIKRYFEFYYELFAQYLKDGKITLKRLSNTIVSAHGPYGRPQQSHTRDVEAANDILDDIERDFHFYAEDVLGNCVGNIYIM